MNHDQPPNKPDTPLLVKDPDELSHEALVEIARWARDFLFFDLWGTQEYYTLDKDVSGADYIEHMHEVLVKHGLVPRCAYPN